MSLMNLHYWGKDADLLQAHSSRLGEQGAVRAATRSLVCGVILSDFHLGAVFFPPLRPWTSYLSPAPQFPHLQNGR